MRRHETSLPILLTALFTISPTSRVDVFLFMDARQDGLFGPQK